MNGCSKTELHFMARFGFVRNIMAEDPPMPSRFLKERKALPLKKGHPHAPQEGQGDKALPQEMIPPCYSTS